MTTHWVILWSIANLPPKRFKAYPMKHYSLEWVRLKMGDLKRDNPNLKFFVTME